MIEEITEQGMSLEPAYRWSALVETLALPSFLAQRFHSSFNGVRHFCVGGLEAEDKSERAIKCEI